MEPASRLSKSLPELRTSRPSRTTGVSHILCCFVVHYLKMISHSLMLDSRGVAYNHVPTFEAITPA